MLPGEGLTNSEFFVTAGGSGPQASLLFPKDAFEHVLCWVLPGAPARRLRWTQPRPLVGVGNGVTFSATTCGCDVSGRGERPGRGSLTPGDMAPRKPGTRKPGTPCGLGRGRERPIRIAQCRVAPGPASLSPEPVFLAAALSCRCCPKPSLATLRGSRGWRTTSLYERSSGGSDGGSDSALSFRGTVPSSPVTWFGCFH